MKFQAMLCVAVVLVASGCQKPSTSSTTNIITSGEKPVIETDEIMELLMDPIHEDLKDAIENPPEKRADWRALYVAAYTLAETNNLLYSRSDHEYMLTTLWREQVDASRAATATLGASIKDQMPYETIKENYLAVVESCNACHHHYDPEERDMPKVEPPRAWDSADDAEAETSEGEAPPQ